MFPVFLKFYNDVLGFFLVSVSKNSNRIFQSQRQSLELFYLKRMMSGSRLFCKPGRG